jgi:hypothetical protein
MTYPDKGNGLHEPNAYWTLTASTRAGCLCSMGACHKRFRDGRPRRVIAALHSGRRCVGVPVGRAGLACSRVEAVMSGADMR